MHGRAHGGAQETEEEEILQKFCITLINSPFLNKAVRVSEATKELAGTKSEGLFSASSASQTKSSPVGKSLRVHMYTPHMYF